jgi:hypothetical protein
MFRNALLSVTAAAGLTVPAAIAGPGVVVYPTYAPAVAPIAPGCRHYTVMYRTCVREPWRAYRVYEAGYRADRAAAHLRHRGFEVMVSVG